MGLPRALGLLLAPFLLLLPGGSPQDPQLVLVAPRLVALGTPLGVMVAATGPVTGEVTAWPGEGGRGGTPCSPPVPFRLGTHNDFCQILSIKVTPEGAQHCGAAGAMGQTLLLEALSPLLPPQRVRVGLGAPRGVLLVQTDKPLYSPGQTVRFRVFSLDPDLQPSPEPILVTITNPLGARVREGQREPLGMLLSDQMLLPDIAPPGQWRVRAQMLGSPDTAGSATFSVRPYALPGFLLRAVPDRRFLLLGSSPSPTLRLRLRVRYPDGAVLGGLAQLRVGLRGGPFLPGLEQRGRVTSGQGEFNVTLERVVAALGTAPGELQGQQLRLAVAVVNDDGGEMVQQEVGIRLVTSPWTLDLAPTPRFFVPGAPFFLLGRVLDAGGSPAAGVEVRVGVGVTGAAPPPPLHVRTDKGGNVAVPINVPSKATGMTLSVEGGSTESPTARVTVMVAPMATVSGRFLALQGPVGPLRPGELLRLQMHDLGPAPDPPRYHLLAVARGQLVAAQGVPRGTVTEVTLPVTPAMAPRLRLVAFYLAGGQLVAATWGVPVASACHGQVRVGVGPRGPRRPQTPLRVTVTVPGGAGGGAPLTVALGATDTALLELEPRHRLSPDKVEAVLGSSDLGCGPGGGPDPQGLFRAAGLVLGEADPPQGPPPRCPSAPSRPRRSPDLPDNALPGSRRCCRDGAAELPLPVSCRGRARRVPVAGGCRETFLRCCRLARDRRARGSPRGGARGLLAELQEAEWGEGPEDEWGEGLGPARSFFPESWLWRRVPSNGSASVTVLLPDSITTWEIQAVAVVPGHGLCVALPQHVPVTQELWVRLQLPPRARPHEQLQLLPHVHSRLPHGINVTVRVEVAEGVCAGLDGTPQHLAVPAGGAVPVPLTLVALQSGDFPVTITARGPWGVSDSLTHVLHIEPEGQLQLEETSYVLDTDDEGGRTLEIPGAIPAGIVPDGEFRVSIRVTGRVGVWAVRGALGEGREGLLRVPRGCGEQALLGLAPPAAALRYLDLSGGWERLPPLSRPRGIARAQRAFERVQNFRRSDGSYSTWRHHPGSTWLTALVLRVLALARPYLPVAAGDTGETLRWLLGQQRPDGTFRENQPVLHREMQGAVGDPGPEATASLTAFVVVALQGTRDLLPPDSPHHPHLDEALSRAATFLRGRVGTLGTFGTAIATYALALGDTGPPGPSPALERLRSLARPAQGGRAQFWAAGAAGASVEASAYGLLALLQLRDSPGATRAARWLRQQSNYGGGFCSTQDTLVALEALGRLWLHWGGEAGPGLRLALTWPGGARGGPTGTQVTLGPGLESVEKELRVPLGSPITVQVEGHGEGTLTVLRQFRLMSPPNGTCLGLGLEVAVTGPIIYEEEDYEDYDEEVEPEWGLGPEEQEEGPVQGAEPEQGAGPMEEAEPAESASPRRRRSRWPRAARDSSRDVAFVVCMWREAGMGLAGMAVAEISLLSGMRPRRDHLDKLRDVVDRWISHYELSETRLVLYLDEVPPRRHCISFGVTQEVAVGQLQPAMAAIYDYYEPARRCSVFYSTPGRSPALPTLCSSRLCLCARGTCPRLRRGQMTLDERLDFACYSPRVQHALLVRVLQQSQEGPFLAFDIDILEVLLGEVPPGGRGRTLARGSCPLRLRPLRRYLLMGEGMVPDAEGRPQFLLGPDWWVEEAPPPTRCSPSPQCHPLLGFLDALRPSGCPF